MRQNDAPPGRHRSNSWGEIGSGAPEMDSAEFYRRAASPAADGSRGRFHKQIQGCIDVRMGDQGAVHAQHDIGHRQTVLALAKRLARPTPDDVATHRMTDAAFWNHQAEAGQTGVVI